MDIKKIEPANRPQLEKAVVFKALHGYVRVELAQGNVAWVTLIVVGKHYRRNGLGTALLKAIMEEYKDRNLYIEIEPFLGSDFTDVMFAGWLTRNGFKLMNIDDAVQLSHQLKFPLISDIVMVKEKDHG